MLYRVNNQKQQQQFLTILQEANQRILDKGLKMWEKEKLTYDQFNKEYQNPIYYLGYLDGVPAYTVILLENDEYFWGEEGIDGSAYYLHKFAIGCQFSGKNLGAMILDEILNEVIQLGRCKLRLDVRKSVPQLVRFYISCGFIQKKEGFFYYGEGLLLEKRKEDSV